MARITTLSGEVIEDDEPDPRFIHTLDGSKVAKAPTEYQAGNTSE